MLELSLMNWAGCDKERNMPAYAIRNQPYDAWMGRTKETEFYLGMWILKLIEWSIVVVGAIVALKLQKVVSIAAGAMIGAELVAAGIEAFIRDAYALIATEEEVA